MRHLREKERDELTGLVFMSFALTFLIMEAYRGSLLSVSLFGLAAWFSYSLTHWLAGKEEAKETSVNREKIISRLKKPEWIFFPSIFMVGIVILTQGISAESLLLMFVGTFTATAGFTGLNYFLKGHG